MLLGFPDKSFLLSAIGIDPKGIFDEGANYNISIQRSFRDASLSIGFFTNVALEIKQIEIIRNAFLENNGDLDINRYLSSEPQKIPSLVVKFEDPSFLIDLNDSLRLLLASGMVKSLNLKIPVKSTDHILSYINNFDIITSAPKNSADCDNFIKNIIGYNFIFLNSCDDYLVDLFFKIQSDIRKFFETDNAKILTILKHFFYASNINQLKLSRYFCENRENKKLDYFFSSIDNISYRLSGLFIVELFSQYLIHLQSFKQKQLSQLQISEGSIECDIFGNFEKAISEIKASDVYKIKLHELVNKLKADKHQKFSKDRSSTFKFLENAIESFLKYYKSYNYKALDKIEEYKENLGKIKSSFVERKKGFLGLSGYVQTDNLFFKAYIEFIDALIKDTENFNQESNLISKDTHIQNLRRILKRVETLQNHSTNDKQYQPLINTILENIKSINTEIYQSNDSVINKNKNVCIEPLSLVKKSLVATM